jgi:Domain of unknown function (DUF4214)
MSRRLLVAVAAAVTVGLAPTLLATPARADTASNDQLVQAWYGAFLQREDPGADGGRGYWVDQLDQGVSRQYVLGSIIRSQEYATVEIAGYYNGLLDRAPDPGANYWIDQTAHHDMAFEWVAQNILASQEFIDREDDGSGAGYVRALYSVVLHRSPSNGEVSYWVGRLRAVGSLNTVREIWYTDEGVRTRLNDNYLYLLLRGVDADGIGYWSSLERQSDITLQVELASTQEFYGNANDPNL